ncbi:MAG: phosphatase PAP2 family protein [Patescibacteria group bacterium]|nr:phosphatase PAP2 family protein [Patescibacteria group bacterium]
MDKPILILIYLFLQFLYVPLNRRPVKYYWKLALDNRLPLVPGMIVIYLSYYVMFFFGGLWLIFSAHFFAFIKVMIAAQLMSDLFWWLFPNGVKRPKVVGQSLLKNWLSKLYCHDKYDGNGAPSAHVFHTLIIGTFLTRLWPQWSLVIFIWMGLIVVSTVLIKQHYVVDVMGGILVAVAAVFF